MKKKYVKPQIVIENFALSETIAAGCELKTPLPSSDEACGFPIRGGVVFTDGIMACEYTEVPGTTDKFCYHVPAAENNLFAS